MRLQGWHSFVSSVLTLAILCLTHLNTSQALQDYAPSAGLVKRLGFNEPDTGIRYNLIAHNVNQTSNKIKSVIKVYKVRLDRTLVQTDPRPQLIQVLEFGSTLVDFDLDCTRKYCFLVTVTNKNRHNLDVYTWTRTQFDLSQTTSSFSIPHSVRIFSIRQSNFYIAIAQDQLQLYPRNTVPSDDNEGLPRFFGCAIIKFITSDDVYEKHLSLKYHQFIPLPFHPLSVEHLVSYDQDKRRQHYLVFSKEPRWQETGSIQSPTFVWSPFDDLFWPFRLSKAVTYERRPNSKNLILLFPDHSIRPVNLTTSGQLPTQHDPVEPVESCFSRLQHLLFDREYATRQLISTINPLWRAITPNGLNNYPIRQPAYTNISNPVIVHGDVIVRGTLVRGARVSIVGVPTHNQTFRHDSPETIDRMLDEADFKLQSLQDKLNHAFLPTFNNVFNSPIRFLREIEANTVLFTDGIRNLDVHLNNVAFKKLRDDLVILDGSQDIMSKVTFRGKVFADSLEIHGRVNGKYFLRDALDIASNQVQVIELMPMGDSPPIGMEFHNVQSPELVMNYNSSFNNIRLSEFITRDSRVQQIFGGKHFKYIETNRLDVDNPDVLLNDVSIARLATQSLKLNSPIEQVLFGRHQTFAKPVRVNRLIINNNINHRINVSSLISDSLKTYDVLPQQISGFKHFKNGLFIHQLTTEGRINGIQMDQVFNLNSIQPQIDHALSMNSPLPLITASSPLTGVFNFMAPVLVLGNLNAGLVNGIDLYKAAVRRFPFGVGPHPPQVVRGHKTFFRTLRVNELSVLDEEQFNLIQDNRIVRQSYVNGFDVVRIKELIQKQISNPPTFYIGTLRLDGNLNLASNHYLQGNISISCPLDAIRSRQILAGSEDQVIEIPVKIGSLRAHHAKLLPGSLDGLSFPDDFVLKSVPGRPGAAGVQVVSGNKLINHIIIGQTLSDIQSLQGPFTSNRNVVFGSHSSVNNLSFGELDSFINHERYRNFTGETVYHSLMVHGNIIAKRINGHRWPDDILLKSVSGSVGPVPFPQVQRRIYSPVVFLNSSTLQVGHLDLKGPVQLQGFLNHVNLTEFGRNSATYGDKDLLSLGRPIRNKIFAGGLNVVNEIRSSGQIDGIHFDEMAQRVVTIGPSSKTIHITSPKLFISDVSFEGPVNINYLNDMPLAPFLKQVLMSEGQQIKVFGKKTITGILRINRRLELEGLVNGMDLARGPLNSTYRPEVEYRSNFTILPSRSTLPPYALPTPRFHGKRDLLAGLDTQRAGVLAAKRPIAIRYETHKHLEPKTQLRRPSQEFVNSIQELKSQIISLSVIEQRSETNLVVGFIESDSTEISNLHLPDKDDHYLEYSEFPRFFLPLDQLRFAFLKSTIYYMSVGATTDSFGTNTTGVYFSVGGSEIRHLFTLPISSPNSALFVRIAHQSTVFLMVSQDYNTILHGGKPQCSLSIPSRIHHPEMYCNNRDESGPLFGGVHVYLFNALLNSSSLTSAYFDLYQTINLPAIDSFEQFQYGGSTYIVAASRLSSQVHLLLLRGYSGFQVASSIDVPLFETVKVLYSTKGNPLLLVYLSNGETKVMEPVIL